jgi:arylformamidase
MKHNRFIDITPLISSRLSVFPGDVSFQRDVSMDFKKGDHLTLSSIRTTLHLGAHADGPNHYSATGEGIGSRDLGLYMGRCLVVRAHAAPGARVERSHLSKAWRDKTAERILVRTDSFPDPDKWNSDFCSLSPTLISDWAISGVKLVGIDTPSIDPEDSKTLDSHQVVARFNLAILEGLVLTEVPEGYYSLLALPLKFEGADASPVRAVLFQDDQLFGA